MAPTAGKIREFREAVRALSVDPGAMNVNRYLAVSRALDHNASAPSARRRVKA